MKIHDKLTDYFVTISPGFSRLIGVILPDIVRPFGDS